MKIIIKENGMYDISDLNNVKKNVSAVEVARALKKIRTTEEEVEYAFMDASTKGNNCLHFGYLQGSFIYSSLEKEA